MSLLEQNNTRKGQVNKLLEPEQKLDVGENKKYKIKDSAVYANKAARGQIPELYYLISLKSYSKAKNTWQPTSIIMYLWKIINTFHKNYPKNPIIISPPIDSSSPMAKPLVKLSQVLEMQARLIHQNCLQKSKMTLLFWKYSSYMYSSSYWLLPKRFSKMVIEKKIDII